MRRRAQELQLGDAEPEDVLHDRGAGRQRSVQAFGNQRIDLAEPPQHRRDQQPGEGSVARRQHGHVGIVFDRVVEGPFTPEDRAEEIERDLPGGWRR